MIIFFYFNYGEMLLEQLLSLLTIRAVEKGHFASRNECYLFCPLTNIVWQQVKIYKWVVRATWQEKAWIENSFE